jgi:hypothetical protein
MAGFFAAPRRDTSRRREDGLRYKSAPRSQRKATARELGVKLSDLAPSKAKDDDTPNPVRKKKHISVRERSAMAAGFIRNQ